ncbi:pectinesterase family protein [Uliginosibacterium paludis]|uniref:Pectinesterase family protein n=1 Tax=Uliginosibacterium paludis TaxID=1615952 RepID=A0ABV2CMZ3_9RHOO
MFASHKASRLRDMASLAFVISALVTGCGGGGTGSNESASGSSGSASSGSSTSTSSDGSGGSASSASSATSSTGNLSVQTAVSGWASMDGGTTGGAGAPASNIYVVHNRAELLNALANKNSPNYSDASASSLGLAAPAAKEPKIIYIVGTVWGTDLGNGKFADEAYYKSTNTTAAKWDFNLYLQSLDTAWAADLAAKVAAGDADAIATNTKVKALSSARSTLARIQKAQIQFQIPSNTTIMGVGSDAKLIDGYFSVNGGTSKDQGSNIIVRNLELQAPQDLTTQYDTKKQEWNAAYKAFGVVTGKHLWIDHCTFSDGAHPDSAEVKTINGYTLEVMRHDGLLDIEDSSDYITVSYSIFKNHDKTNMVGGSGDQNYAKERDYNHLTFSHNIWQDSVQRAPRVRFAKAHVYNNYYTGDTDKASYATSYYIGMGAESKILSESNVFDLTGSKATVSQVISNLNGYQFKDNGSWFNGAPASAALEAAAKAALEARWTSAVAAQAGSSGGFTLAAYTNELGWTPTYGYTLGSSAAQVREHNLANAGAGKLIVAPAAMAIRPQLTDSAATSYTVAKALAGSDAWAPQLANADQPNVGRINLTGVTPNYVVAQDGTGGYTTIQAALNAASNDTSGAARLYIQVKAGTYNEQLIVAHATTPITLYSTESDASKVVVSTALYQNSVAADYTAMNGATFATSVYATSTNSTIKTDYNACYRAAAVGKQCSTAIRIHNDGFNAVNLTFQNTWGDTDAKGNNQALAAMVDKADKVVFDGVRLISNQDTLYLNNTGKRTYFTGGEITGDVDFIFGSGTAVFEGANIRYTGTRKPSGGYNAAPSTPTAQAYGFIFSRCVFSADAATTDNSVFLARQWDTDSSTVGKMIVRDSIIGKHIATTSGPWNATTVNSAATVYGTSSEAYLAEYGNWDEAAKASSSTSSSAASSAAASSAAASSSSSAAASSSAASSSAGASSSAAASSAPGTNTTIAGSGTLTTAYASGALSVPVSTSYDSVNGTYTLVSAGLMGTNVVLSDSMQFAYKQVTGDFTLIASLTSLEMPAALTNTSTIRAGVMVRNDLTDNSRFYGELMRGSGKVYWEQRLADGGAVSSSTVTNTTITLPLSTPIMMKLRRVNQAIYVSYSVDSGVTFSAEKTQDFSTATGATQLGSTVYVGLVGVSGNTGITDTSVFNGVSITTP